MKDVIEFLHLQRILAIACSDDTGPWVASVYMGTVESGLIYFVSPKTSRHSQMILRSPSVAFSCAWSDSIDPSNRKGVQGQGECSIVSSVSEISVGLMSLHRSVPGLSKVITVDWILNNGFESKLWKIEPNYIKFWNDELYGDEESREFVVSRGK